MTTPTLLFDVSDRAKVTFTGKDRAVFLNSFCTNDLVKLPPGGGSEALLLTGQARIVARMLVYAGADTLWVDADPGRGPGIVGHLAKFIISEDVEVADRTAEFAQWFVTGPEAGKFLPQDLAADQFVERWPLGGADCQVRRTDAFHEPGYEILAPASAKAEVQRALSAGAAPGDPAAFEARRIEAGIPVYGQDVGEANLPQELNRTERAISFTKGCYLGQETVARIRAMGHVNRFLVGLRFASPVTAGAPLVRNGQEVGQVTSAAWSERLGATLALGYLRRGHADPGTAVEAVTAGGNVAGVVSPLPCAPGPAGSPAR